VECGLGKDRMERGERPGSKSYVLLIPVVELCLLLQAVPNTKLCAWGEEDSGGHVL
jgi:hypothetical protein